MWDKAFGQLKAKLSSPPIFSFPQFNMEFTVDWDASLEGLGAVLYGGPVDRGYEQRFESKNAYEQRSKSKIAYGPRAKLRTNREQNCVRTESKIAYGPRAKLRTVREQNCVQSESKNAQELRAYDSCLHMDLGITPFVFFFLKKMASRCIASVIRL